MDLHQRMLKAAVAGEAGGVLEPEALMELHLRCKQAATEAFVKDAIPVWWLRSINRCRCRACLPPLPHPRCFVVLRRSRYRTARRSRAATRSF